MNKFTNNGNISYEGANNFEKSILYHDSIKKKYLSTLFEQQEFENNLLQMYIKLMKVLQALNTEKIASERQLSSCLGQLQMLYQQKRMLQSCTKQLKNECASLQENNYILKKNEKSAFKNMKVLKEEISKEKENFLLLQNQLQNYKLKVLDIEGQKLAIAKTIESRLQKYKIKKLQLASTQEKHQHILTRLDSIQQQYEQLNRTVAFKISDNQSLTQEIILMTSQHQTISSAINHKIFLLQEEQQIIKQFSSHQSQLVQQIQINNIQIRHYQDTKLLYEKIAQESQQKQLNQYTIERLQQHLKNILKVNKQIQQFLLDCYQQDDALLQLVQKRMTLNSVVSRQVNQSHNHQLTERYDKQVNRIHQIGNNNNKEYFPQNRRLAKKNRFNNQFKKLTLDKENIC